jgi:putative ABC transport system permease protein
MSIREKTREVALLRCVGFLPKTIVLLFVAESLAICFAAWFFADLATYALVHVLIPSGALMTILINIKATTLMASLAVAVTTGMFSAIVPSYRATRVNIVDGLRHIG